MTEEQFQKATALRLEIYSLDNYVKDAETGLHLESAPCLRSNATNTAVWDALFHPDVSKARLNYLTVRLEKLREMHRKLSEELAAL